MSERLPVVSGEELIAALGKLGWASVRQRGSHVRLKHPDRSVSLVVPLHRELTAPTPGSPARAPRARRRRLSA